MRPLYLLNAVRLRLLGAPCSHYYELPVLTISRLLLERGAPLVTSFSGAQLLSAWPRRKVMAIPQPLRVRPRRESAATASPHSPLSRPSLGRSGMSGIAEHHRQSMRVLTDDSHAVKAIA